MQRATAGSAGFDLAIDLGNGVTHKTWLSGEMHLVGTGVKVAIPHGYVGLVFPRSSMGVKLEMSLANTVGVIDSDYRGEIKLAIRNHGQSPRILKNGERVAQLVIVPCFMGDISLLEVTDTTIRGEGGFGSTGE